MKTKKILMGLGVVVVALTATVAIWEIHKYGGIARRPMTVPASDIETYYNLGGIYRSIGPTSRVKQSNEFNWSWGGSGTTDYRYVLGMKPGTTGEIQFDVLVIRKKQDLYPQPSDIDNFINLNEWDVKLLGLSFSVPVDKTNTIYNQGLPGVTHEIISGKGVKLLKDWASIRAQMSGWDDGNTFLKDLDKVKAGEKDLDLLIALMGDEAFVQFNIHPPMRTADVSGTDPFTAAWRGIETSFENVGDQFKSAIKGETSPLYVHYLVSTAALVGWLDCSLISVDEPVEKTAVSGKPACSTDPRRNGIRNALGDRLDTAGISTGLQEVVFEELGI